MESALDRFKTLNYDVIINIMSRLDGCTIAAMASTCTDLRDAAKDELLWKKLCHETWPSTSIEQLHFSRGFKSLYVSAFPLILYDEAATNLVPKQIPTSTTLDHTCSSDHCELTSLIDIYFRGQCIFSKIVDGITEGPSCTNNNNFYRISYYPYKLELFGIICPNNVSSQEYINLTSAFTGYEERHDLSNKIARDMRLSWILLDKRQGKAVNISSWKPQSTQRSNDDYTINFGCIIPIEDSTINHMLAECVIMTKFTLMVKQRNIRWKEITLTIKDMNGLHLNGKHSMRVMKRALVCPRSINHSLVEVGYKQYNKKKIELKLRDERDESVANILSAATAIAMLLGICYTCSALL